MAEKYCWFSVFTLLVFSSCLVRNTFCWDVQTNSVSLIEISPTIFNWSYSGIEGSDDLTSTFTISSSSRTQYTYRVSLDQLVDLPSWLDYFYSHKFKVGLLYGVFPHSSVSTRPRIQIVGLNRKTYESRIKVIEFNVTERLEPLYKMEIKVDNMNVDDMLIGGGFERLKDTIVKHVWPESELDNTLIFIAPATRLGARKPANPDFTDGVVVHFGSRRKFSRQAEAIEDEVRPLWKLPPCPRNFKRTTVDRHFRDAGFALDWCTFRLRRSLVKYDNGMMMVPHNEETEMMEERFGQHRQLIPPSVADLPLRSQVPKRTYTGDMLASLVVPLLVLLVLVVILSFTLCFHHDYLLDEPSDSYFENIFSPCEDYLRHESVSSSGDGSGSGDPDKLSQYEAVQRATATLRSMSNNRELTASPRLTAAAAARQEEQDTSRPSPPPYGTATRRVIEKPT